MMNVVAAKMFCPILTWDLARGSQRTQLARDHRREMRRQRMRCALHATGCAATSRRLARSPVSLCLGGAMWPSERAESGTGRSNCVVINDVARMLTRTKYICVCVCVCLASRKPKANNNNLLRESPRMLPLNGSLIERSSAHRPIHSGCRCGATSAGLRPTATSQPRRNRRQVRGQNSSWEC